MREHNMSNLSIKIVPQANSTAPVIHEIKSEV